MYCSSPLKPAACSLKPACSSSHDWRTHLKLAHDELGFTGIRGHGILDDDMSVLPQMGKKGDSNQYSFYNVDQVFDYLLEIGIRPIVELSFTPSALVSSCRGAEKACHYAFGNRGGYKGLTMPPDDFDEWRALIQALAQHLVDRYGLDEVAQWHFEGESDLDPSPHQTIFHCHFCASME